MSDASSVKFMMMGLPHSGKSTFVAALWQVVQSPDVPEAMTLGPLNGDYTYINKLHKLWTEGEELPRTDVGQEGIISIPLRNRSPQSKSTEVEVILPDLSGESFNQQWEMRTMLAEYHKHLIESTGLLIFIHSQKFNPGELLSLNTVELENILLSDEKEDTSSEVKDEEASTLASDPSEDSQQVEEATAPVIKSVPFQAENVPTQTKVVDLLQQALWLTARNQIRKVVLIISAWDLVRNRIGSPTEWLDTAMPLLAQYIKSNNESFSYRVFGISAQGAEYSKESRVALLGQRNASKRITVTDGKTEHNNITAPLQWLMSE